jgi:sulfoxide reductase heme-binding subunit YedZ
MTRSRIRLLKIVTFIASLLPLAWLATGATLNKLGVNPVEAVINRLGWWALTFLVLSIACTPLKLVLGWTWPLQLRRMLGLFAFFYATLHLSTYVVIDRDIDFGEILDDVLKRKFIAVGMLTWLLLLPLALTSTNGWTRRLGFRRWKAIHRLAYVAVLIGCVHFLWKGKVILPEPVIFTVIAVSLLTVRVIRPWRTAASPAAR